MASSTTTAGGFSVEKWLEVVNCSQYTVVFNARGYVNYETCASLSEEDVRAVVNNHPTVKLMNRVKELRKLSEKDAAEILWVSTRNKCTVCMKGILLPTAFRRVRRGVSSVSGNPLYYIPPYP